MTPIPPQNTRLISSDQSPNRLSTRLSLNYRVVIRPCSFEPMRHLVYWPDAIYSEDQKARSRGTDTSNHPHYIFHRTLPE